MPQRIVRVIAAAAIASAALLAYMAYRIGAQGDRDERRPADAIVVLGAAQFNGVPGGVFAARLDHAVALFEEGLAPYLLVTGGKLPADRTTEAESARRYAIQHGVPEDRILFEDQGSTTLESLEAVGAIFRQRGFTSAVFVSDETHMLRVLRMASDQGIEAFGSPTRTSPTDRDEARRRKSIVHELAGLAAYYVGGGRLLDDTATTGSP
ncbi:MAG TPA: YdcF family protein [Candidatus Limnocylindria bacterium]|nr:YdcF family protein [Candidatus Limnocylindria bacterium]